MTVEFDKPLSPAHYSINLGGEGREHFPVRAAPHFLPGGKAIVLPLELKPGWSYSFVLTSHGFASTDGYPLRDYEISFRTK